MSSSSTYLITGANRGIGRGLVSAYLASSGNRVIAAVRDLSHPSTQSLRDLPTGQGSDLILVQMDASSSKSIEDTVDNLSRTHGIQTLDVVIANAGIGKIIGPLLKTTPSEIQEFINVNAYGRLELFKSVLPLLRKSAFPKFVSISGLAGSLTNMDERIPVGAYGASKALANFIIKRLALENTDVVTWAMHPGMVATDMGTAGFKLLADNGIDVGVKPLSVEESAQGIKSVIDAATKGTSGRFIGYDGQELSW